MRRVAVVTSHPIQYHAPWFRALAGACDLTVFFAHRQDADGQARAGFDRPFAWDVPLLDGYRSEWLENVSGDPGVDRFAGCDTPGVAQVLAKGAFDACVVTGWYLRTYVQAIRACRRLGVPVLLRGDSQLASPRSVWLRAAKYLPYRWWLNRVDAHLYVGRANREYLRHYGVPDSRLFFAPHCVENERFAAEADKARACGDTAALRARWGAGESTTVFLFVGKLLARKRPADLLEAAARLTRAGEDIRAVFVGSGSEESGLRNRVAAFGVPAFFEGFQNQSALARFYAAGDSLVLPSDGRETWGLVVNEAMATGLPAIVSDVVGCGADLIDSGRTGFQYRVADVGDLTNRMRDMIAARRTRAREMAGAVREKINGYSCQAAADGTIRAIETIAARRSRESVPVQERVRA